MNSHWITVKNTLTCYVFHRCSRYGELHPRTVKLTYSDSRFWKNPEFVFYYLWQKETRELSSGIYNVLSPTSKRHQSVKQFVDGINSSDAGIEANLSIVLQSVRGTKQFWFCKKSDVMAMIRKLDLLLCS